MAQQQQLTMEQQQELFLLQQQQYEQQQFEQQQFEQQQFEAQQQGQFQFFQAPALQFQAPQIGVPQLGFQPQQQFEMSQPQQPFGLTPPQLLMPTGSSYVNTMQPQSVFDVQGGLQIGVPGGFQFLPEYNEEPSDYEYKPYGGYEEPSPFALDGDKTRTRDAKVSAKKKAAKGWCCF